MRGLTLAVLLDARARGADILNRRAVTAITPLANGYAVELDERGQKRSVEARFIVNAAGPWVGARRRLTEAAPPPRPLRLVRGSHIVLPCPTRRRPTPIRCRTKTSASIFVIPWLEGRFLIVGTTDVPHEGDAGDARMLRGRAKPICSLPITAISRGRRTRDG